MKQVRDPVAIRAALDARDLTRRELARLVECSVGTIQRILDGQPVDGERAVRIARSLRQPVDRVFVAVASSDELSIDARKATA